MKRALLVIAAVGCFASTASAQYAVGHRTFGVGTAMGGGYSKLDYQFPGIDDTKPFLLLPTLEFKIFLGDQLSLDFSVPVVNIAASNAMQEYFFYRRSLPKLPSLGAEQL